MGRSTVIGAWKTRAAAQGAETRNLTPGSQEIPPIPPEHQRPSEHEGTVDSYINTVAGLQIARSAPTLSFAAPVLCRQLDPLLVRTHVGRARVQHRRGACTARCRPRTAPGRGAGTPTTRLRVVMQHLASCVPVYVQIATSHAPEFLFRTQTGIGSQSSPGFRTARAAYPSNTPQPLQRRCTQDRVLSPEKQKQKPK